MKFDKTKYKIYTWKNWMMLHWILNPGLIINELILGQRIPKITLEDKTSDKPRLERTFIPCPHCQTKHDARTWSTQNGTAFKNWFGLYCPECSNIIPCLMNAFTALVLGLTYPLWGWFKTSLKNKWLANQPQRFHDIDIKKVTNPFEGKRWIITGLIWGGSMFILMTFIFPYFDDTPINTPRIMIGLIVWTLAGLAFGYTMKLYFNKKLKK